MNTLEGTDSRLHWQEAIDLAGLHMRRSIVDLDQEMVCKLVRLLPAVDLALCIADAARKEHRVQLAVGDSCPWRAGEHVDPDSWQTPESRRLPVHYSGQLLGSLVVSGPFDQALEPVLLALLTHYGVALVNLTLGEEERHATQHYCASLQALEEGITLFQESDSEAILARFLCLSASMMRATAGALFVFEEVGNPESTLRLAQTMGMPDHLLATFDGAGNGTWPRAFQQRGPFHAERAQDPTLGGLDPASLPEMLRDLVSLPLRYLGVDAGLCVLFNVAPEGDDVREHLDRLTSLGQLGAALLHRLNLEAISSHQRSMAKELQIAAAIQQRLLPTRAPRTNDFEFAWRSLSANNIGGDYLDLLVSDLGDLYAVIADASGHGINSAMLMSSFRSTYRSEAQWLEPEELCGNLNDEVANEVGTTGMFITAASLRIERETRRLSISSAGHNPVLLYRAATQRITVISSHGPPLGFMADSTYEAEQHDVRSGDVLLLYTDGISEATNTNLDMFGDDRVQDVLQRTANLPATEILQALQHELTRFTGRVRYDDDVSLSVIKVR